MTTQGVDVHQLHGEDDLGTMLIVFFDHWTIEHHKFVSEETIVSQHFCKQVLSRLIARIRRVRHDLWRSNRWILRHDNAPVHVAISIRQLLAKNRPQSSS